MKVSWDDEIPNISKNNKSSKPPTSWVCLKIVYPIVPNGFADHYPYEKWLFHWGYTQHFQTNPLFFISSLNPLFLFIGNITYYYFQTNPVNMKVPSSNLSASTRFGPLRCRGRSGRSSGRSGRSSSGRSGTAPLACPSAGYRWLISRNMLKIYNRNDLGIALYLLGIPVFPFFEIYVNLCQSLSSLPAPS